MFKTIVYDRMRSIAMVKHESEHTKTKERILRAAFEVFAKRGFHNTTVRDICQKADVNVAAINYYFNTKEKLYEEVCKYACGISSRAMLSNAVCIVSRTMVSITSKNCCLLLLSSLICFSSLKISNFTIL